MFGIQPQFPRGKRLRLHGLFVACAALLASAAITSAAYDIYWTKDTLIYGSAADGMNPTVVFDGTGIMAGRAIDVAVTDTHIYWTDNGDPANPTASQIWRAERNGDNAAPFILPNALYTAPQFLEIDEANNKLYFTSWTEGLFSADLDTGENLDLIVKPFSNHTGIALLNSNEMALITAADDSNAIWVVNLTTKTASEQFFGAGSHQTYGLVADTENNLLYRTDHATGERTIRQISINPTSDVPLYTAAGRPLGIDLSPSGKYLVFVEGTTLTALNLETGTASPLVHGLAAFGVALAADPAPREDLVFMDDFESYTPNEPLPEDRWNWVRQGDARGTVTIHTDETGIFRQGNPNQYVQVSVFSPQTAINLGVTNIFEPGAGPELITFSMEFIEPNESPFTTSSRLGMRMYSGTGTGTTLDQLDVRELRNAGLYEQNDHVRVDYLINTTDQDVEYSRDDGTGSWTLPANSAAAWAYDPAVGPGDEPGIVGLELTNADSFTGFLMATFSGNSIVLNIDNVRIYNEIVVGRDLPELQIPESGFAVWQADKFNSEELGNPAISGPDAAPAGDGISNLMKYALGLEPHTPARDRLPIAGFIGDQLALVYQRPAGIDDVEYVVEVSTDLVTWDSGELLTAEEIIAEGGIETVTVRAIDFPGDPSSRGFMRLRALQK